MFYRLQQFAILLAHLILLYWMIFTLQESGSLTMTLVIIHFVGMALYGAALIRGTAFWANYHYQKKLTTK
ncbi:MAG: hypothetical protein HOM21_03460 [Halobacteriovoraceae bacterium]|jgi:hypothetical protein|nr:hypothetical protein [Halobacteriovoraceae bacterium]